MTGRGTKSGWNSETGPSLSTLVQVMVVLAVMVRGAPGAVSVLLPVMIAPADGIAIPIALARAGRSTALGMLVKTVGFRLEIAAVAVATVLIGTVVAFRVREIVRERRLRRSTRPAQPTRPTQPSRPAAPSRPAPPSRPARPAVGRLLNPVDPLGAEVVMCAPAGTVGRVRAASRWWTARSTTGPVRAGETYRVIAADGELLVVTRSDQGAAGP